LVCMQLQRPEYSLQIRITGAFAAIMIYADQNLIHT